MLQRALFGQDGLCVRRRREAALPQAAQNLTRTRGRSSSRRWRGSNGRRSRSRDTVTRTASRWFPWNGCTASSGTIRKAAGRSTGTAGTCSSIGSNACEPARGTSQTGCPYTRGWTAWQAGVRTLRDGSHTER